jgi:hypothetical protein
MEAAGDQAAWLAWPGPGLPVSRRSAGQFIKTQTYFLL